MSNDRLSTLRGDYYKVEVIAALFGLSVRRIQQLTQEGILSTEEISGGRKYELVPTIQKYVEYLSEKAYEKNRSEAESELKQQKLKAEIELKELQGEYRKIQNDITTGKYIRVEDVESDYRSFFVTLKKFALSIPSKLSVRLNEICGDPSEIRTIEAELNHDIITLLNNFVVAGHSEKTEEVVSVGKVKKANTQNKKVRCS